MRAYLLQDLALRYFSEVAHSGSLTEASQRLHIAASALSRQIATLESHLGSPLFERHPRGMVLTAAGEILLQHVRRTRLDAENALTDIEALQGMHAGCVRLATSDAFANEFIPRLCTEFQRCHAGIQFDVQSLPTPQVSDAVRAGDADIGLCFGTAPQKNVQVVYRQSAPVLAILPPEHPLAQHAALSLAQLSQYPLALPPPHAVARKIVNLVCNRQGLQLNPALESNNARTLQHFVVQGGGVSISSEISARYLVAEGLLAMRPLQDPGMDLRDVEVQTLAHRTLPLAAQAFLRLLQQRLPPSSCAEG